MEAIDAAAAAVVVIDAAAAAVDAAAADVDAAAAVTDAVSAVQRRFFGPHRTVSAEVQSTSSSRSRSRSHDPPPAYTISHKPMQLPNYVWTSPTRMEALRQCLPLISVEDVFEEAIICAGLVDRSGRHKVFCIEVMAWQRDFLNVDVLELTEEGRHAVIQRCLGRLPCRFWSMFEAGLTADPSGTEVSFPFLECHD